MNKESVNFPLEQPENKGSSQSIRSKIMQDQFILELFQNSDKLLSQPTKKEQLFSFADIISLSRIAVNVLAARIDIDSHKNIYSAAHIFSMTLDYLDGKFAKKFGGGKYGDIIDAVSDHVAIQPALRVAAKREIIPELYADIFAGRDFMIDADRIYTRLTDPEKGKKNVVRLDRDKDAEKTKADKVSDALFLIEKTAVGVLTPHSPFFTEVFANAALLESLNRGVEYIDNSDIDRHILKAASKLKNLFRRKPQFRKLD